MARSLPAMTSRTVVASPRNWSDSPVTESPMTVDGFATVSGTPNCRAVVCTTASLSTLDAS